MPPPQQLSLIDPRLLAWLSEPQLVQRAEKELEDYGLQVGGFDLQGVACSWLKSMGAFSSADLDLMNYFGGSGGWWEFPLRPCSLKFRVGTT